MNHFIGIDGGGSKTRGILTDGAFNILASSEGGPSNPLSVGTQKSSLLLAGLIKKLFKVSGVAKVDSAVIGLAGAGRREKADEIKRSLLKLTARNESRIKKIEVTSDIKIFVEGAFSGKSGSVLIAGTGSVIISKNRGGKFFRAGGYGKILGDEGSGYSIGSKGLKAVAKNFDGRGDKTIMAELVEREFGIRTPDELITKIYSGHFDVASAAPVVISAAEEGDAVCKKILDEEIAELILHIKAAVKSVNEKKMRLCLGGGLLSSKNYYSNRLVSKIKMDFGDIKISEPDYPPEAGAVFLAANNLNKIKTIRN
ncbi:MAG: BadF/BadG/BcrA/BcrD ATPase family protein [Melioribacteraceae bacterium]